MGKDLKKKLADLRKSYKPVAAVPPLKPSESTPASPQQSDPSPAESDSTVRPSLIDIEERQIISDSNIIGYKRRRPVSTPALRPNLRSRIQRRDSVHPTQVPSTEHEISSDNQSGNQSSEQKQSDSNEDQSGSHDTSDEEAEGISKPMKQQRERVGRGKSRYPRSIIDTHMIFSNSEHQER